MIGRRFGRLTAMEPTEERVNRSVVWLCKCDCGQEKRVSRLCLVTGKVRSCGCLNRESATRTSTTHGMHDTPEWHAWKDMKARCLNPNLANFHNYGGRGITVCERWLRFENFIADVGRRPSPLHSLDRIDNDGNYEPGNVRWATAKQQSANKRASKTGRDEAGRYRRTA